MWPKHRNSRMFSSQHLCVRYSMLCDLGAWNVCTSPLCYTLVARLPSDWYSHLSGVRTGAVQQSALYLNESKTVCTSPGSAFYQAQVPGAWTVWHSGGINSRVSDNVKKSIFSEPGVGNKCQWASTSHENVKSSRMSCTQLTIFFRVIVWCVSAIIWLDSWLVWNVAPSDLWNDRDVRAPWERRRFVRRLELHAMSSSGEKND